MNSNKPQVIRLDSETATYCGIVLNKKPVLSTVTKTVWAFEVNGVAYVARNLVDAAATIRKVGA